TKLLYHGLHIVYDARAVSRLFDEFSEWLDVITFIDCDIDYDHFYITPFLRLHYFIYLNIIFAQPNKKVKPLAILQ
ncbi:hypothetical protein, partial [Staphylococcus pseudintermedius]|uniref:hypothetical protein n=1 Tax=Staphylococcus pseudintermedius TaxID=283734 RepID=UPI001CA3FC7A